MRSAKGVGHGPDVRSDASPRTSPSTGASVVHRSKYPIAAARRVGSVSAMSLPPAPRRWWSAPAWPAWPPPAGWPPPAIDVVVLEAADAAAAGSQPTSSTASCSTAASRSTTRPTREAARVLDHAALDLRAVHPGRAGPGRRPAAPGGGPAPPPAGRPGTVLAPIGSPPGQGAGGAAGSARDALAARPAGCSRAAETTTYEALRRRGLSDTVIDRFLRPFLAGVFLERRADHVQPVLRPGLAAASPAARVCVPAGGMRRIPEQLAARLPGRESCSTGRSAVSRLRAGCGRHRPGHGPARAVVVATDPATAARLLPGADRLPPMHAVTTVYHAAPEPPVAEPTLLLDGERRRDESASTRWC